MLRRSAPNGGTTVSAGFSLLELMVTIIVIAVLMILVYGGNSRSRQQRKLAACKNNLLTLSAAMKLYTGDHAGRFPAVNNGSAPSDEPLSLLVPRYTSLTASFICPGSRDKRLPESVPFIGRRISYSYYMGLEQPGPARPLMSDWQVDTRLKVRGDPLFSADGTPPGNNHDRYGGNVLFTDGHVEKLSPKASVALLLGDEVVLLNPRP